MAGINIGGIDTQITFTNTIVGKPFKAEGFGEDDMFECSDIENILYGIGVDGRVSASKINTVCEFTLTLKANSPTLPILYTIQSVQNNSNQPVAWTTVITLPSVGRNFVFLEAVLVSGLHAPTVKKEIQDQKFKFMAKPPQWSNIGQQQLPSFKLPS